MFGDEWKLQFANPKENAFSEILWKTVWLLIDTKRIWNAMCNRVFLWKAEI